MPHSAPANPHIGVLPVGSHEQHGDHLPLDTDTLIAQIITTHLCREYGLTLLPAIGYGTSAEHGDFPGTISVSGPELEHSIETARLAAHAVGVAQVVIVNGHGGNYLEGYATAVNQQSRRLHRGLSGSHTGNSSPWRPPVLLYPDGPARSAARQAAGCPNGDIDMHAGDYETSIMLAYQPENVRDSYRESDFTVPDWSRDLHLFGMAALTPTGVIGLPSQASAEKGRTIVESLVRGFKARLDLITQGRPHPTTRASHVDQPRRQVCDRHAARSTSSDQQKM